MFLGNGHLFLPVHTGERRNPIPTVSNGLLAVFRVLPNRLLGHLARIVVQGHTCILLRLVWVTQQSPLA